MVCVCMCAAQVLPFCHLGVWLSLLQDGLRLAQKAQRHCLRSVELTLSPDQVAKALPFLAKNVPRFFPHYLSHTDCEAQKAQRRYLHSVELTLSPYQVRQPLPFLAKQWHETMERKSVLLFFVVCYT